jgi:hypothetical protein
MRLGHLGLGMFFVAECIPRAFEAIIYVIIFKRFMYSMYTQLYFGFYYTIGYNVGKSFFFNPGHDYCFAYYKYMQ